jgi:NSS family neurotransmitter:Na+ symporter
MTGRERGSWTGRLGFVLAAAGSAVGLGNLWKFPYLTYRHGGGSEGAGAGAFVLVYLGAVLLIGLPVMAAEIWIGKRTGMSPVGAFKALRPRGWRWVGALGVATGFVLLSYYSVVAGWTLQYMLLAFAGQLNGDAAALGGQFTAFLADPGRQVGFHFVFMALTVAIIAGGVTKGIERASRVLMPALFAILLLLVARGLTLDGGGRALGFLFRPDLSALTGKAVLEAIGQAFFSLSLGMGAIITYGSYLGREQRIGGIAVRVVLLDTLVALMAAVIVFSAVFDQQLSLDSGGLGNLFTTIPMVFERLPGGVVLLPLFYVLVVFAALTSTISLLETVSAYFIDERGFSRRRAALLSGTAVFLLGIPSALSFNSLGHATLGGKTFFDWADFLCSNVSLPLGGLLVAVFVGWVLRHDEIEGELSPGLQAAWRFLLRVVAPLAIGALMVAMLTGLVEV